MPMPVHGGGSSRMLVVAAWVGVASAATADRPRWLAAADADLTRRLCAIEASPERYHDPASFLAVPAARRDAVLNPFLNDSYPLTAEMLDRASRPACASRFQRKLAQVAARRPPRLKVCVAGGSETAGNGCLGRDRGRPEPADRCAWWRRLSAWLDVSYPGVRVTVEGRPRSGETTAWFRDALASPAGRVWESCDVLFVDFSLNDAATYDGAPDGPDAVARAVRGVEARVHARDDGDAPATVWLHLPRIVSLSVNALDRGGPLVRGNGTRAVYDALLGGSSSALLSYTDVVAPEVEALVRAREARRAAVFHNAGAHGAHIDWRNHQLVADTVAHWWRGVALGLCERARRGLAPVPPCDGDPGVDDDDDGLGSAQLGCAGSLRSTDPAREAPQLVPSAPTAWRLVAERPDAPAGWHAADGEVVFDATCRAGGDRLEDAALRLGSLRTDDARWGAVKAWTTFADDADPAVARLRAAGYGEGPAVTISAKWRNRASAVVFDRIPCYAAPPNFPRVETAATVRLRLHVELADPTAAARHFKVLSLESCDTARDF